MERVNEPAGLVYVDDAPSRRAVRAIMRRCGFVVVAEVATVADALVAVELSRPDAVVLDLALTGDLGLGIVPVLKAAAPGCAVLVVSSFATLRAAALEAGADAFFAGDDLRGLERPLRVRARRVSGAAAGPEPGAAAQSRPRRSPASTSTRRAPP